MRINAIVGYLPDQRIAPNLPLDIHAPNIRAIQPDADNVGIRKRVPECRELLANHLRETHKKARDSLDDEPVGRLPIDRK